MYTLGLNTYHADASAALLLNGEIICATEEERFVRKKHFAGFPKNSIDYCLKYANISINEITAVCVGRDTNAKLGKKLLYTLSNYRNATRLISHRKSNWKNVNSIKALFEVYYGSCPPIKNIEHHRAHLASAFFSSPFKSSTVVSIDGSGDFSTVMIARGNGSVIDVLESQDYPVSVGFLYTAFTQFLGFPHYGDEYKVMGLAPYGEPHYFEKFKQIMWLGKKNILDWDKTFFSFKTGAVSYINDEPRVNELFNKTKFQELFGDFRQPTDGIDKRHKDIACSLQRYTEHLIFGILERAFKLAKSENLCLAGGVAQNSVANGKILANTSFTNLYIPSAGHDAGISMGAAQYHYFNNLRNNRAEALYNANLGIEFSNDEIKSILDEEGLEYTYLEDEKLFPYVAQKISSESVIGFFDGKAEFGPRALGSRSILADPRNSKAQELLNAKIKRRESFRPFAPSILEEYGNEYFEDYQFTPFMERVLTIKSEKRNLIPAVTHVDGTGRLQSVNKELRPRYYSLISAFYELTGIPILINTSFNENEPVVNHPREAISTFLRTNLDTLILGNFLLEKKEL